MSTTFLEPEAIEALIDQGHPIVVHEGYALDLEAWINHHPGGKLAILHMVGRDATDEINMYVGLGALLLPPSRVASVPPFPVWGKPLASHSHSRTATTPRAPCC
jgi:hypothetical protein